MVTKRYMEEMNITREELETLTRAGVKRRCDERSRRAWRMGMMGKESLRNYRRHKERFGMERWWKATEEERVMRWFQAGVVWMEASRRERCGGCRRETSHILFECGETEAIRRRF